MKRVFTGLWLSAAMAGLSMAPALAEGTGDFQTGKWTDTTFETRTMPDGSETERETNVGAVCIDEGNDTVASLEETFLKVYADRQCTISDPTFESATDTITQMTATIMCGPLSGSLTVKYARVLVNVSSLFVVDTGDGDLVLHTRSRWQRTAADC